MTSKGDTRLPGSKLVAQRSGGNQRLWDVGEGKAVIEDVRRKMYSAPLNLQSALARGYWVPAQEENPEQLAVKALLELGTDVAKSFSEAGIRTKVRGSRGGVPGAGNIEGLISVLPGNAGVAGDTVSGDVAHGHGPRRGGLDKLLKYWRPIMKKPGGFTRCREILADHPELYPLEPLCAWLHHETTGLWPNEGCHHPGMRNCRNHLHSRGKNYDAIVDLKTAAFQVKRGRIGRALLAPVEINRPNPIRSAIGRTVVGKPNIGKPIGNVAAAHCPAGYEFGGQFTNAAGTNCGVRLFTAASATPALTVANAAKAPSSTALAAQERGVTTAAGHLDAAGSGFKLVRSDGEILSPKVSLARLATAKSSDLINGTVVTKALPGAKLGQNEMPLMANGVRSVVFVLPGRATLAVSRSKATPLNAAESASMRRLWASALSSEQPWDIGAALRSFVKSSGGKFQYAQDLPASIENPNDLVEISNITNPAHRRVPTWIWKLFYAEGAPGSKWKVGKWEIVESKN